MFAYLQHGRRRNDRDGGKPFCASDFLHGEAPLSLLSVHSFQLPGTFCSVSIYLRARGAAQQIKQPSCHSKKPAATRFGAIDRPDCTQHLRARAELSVALGA
jgi:hypothetical protein